jgi:GTPase SAR1 family protein
MEGTKATVLKTDLNYASERLLDIKKNLPTKLKEIKSTDSLGEDKQDVFEIIEGLRTRFLQYSADLESPFKIAVVGSQGTGKSTLVNLLLGESLMPSTTNENENAVIRVAYPTDKSLINQAVFEFNDDSTEQTSIGEANILIDKATRNKEDDEKVKNIKYVTFYLDNSKLKEIELINTPGMNVLTEDFYPKVKHLFTEADVILWVNSSEQILDKFNSSLIERIHSDNNKIVGVITFPDKLYRQDEYVGVTDVVEQFMNNIEKDRLIRVDGKIGLFILNGKFAQVAYAQKKNLKFINDLDEIEDDEEKLKMIYNFLHHGFAYSDDKENIEILKDYNLYGLEGNEGAKLNDEFDLNSFFKFCIDKGFCKIDKEANSVVYTEKGRELMGEVSQYNSFGRFSEDYLVPLSKESKYESVFGRLNRALSETDSKNNSISRLLQIKDLLELEKDKLGATEKERLTNFENIITELKGEYSNWNKKEIKFQTDKFTDELISVISRKIDEDISMTDFFKEIGGSLTPKIFKSNKETAISKKINEIIQNAIETVLTESIEKVARESNTQIEYILIKMQKDYLSNKNIEVNNVEQDYSDLNSGLDTSKILKDITKLLKPILNKLIKDLLIKIAKKDLRKGANNFMKKNIIKPIVILIRKLLKKGVQKAVTKKAAQTATKGAMGPAGWAMLVFDVFSIGNDLRNMYKETKETLKESLKNEPSFSNIFEEEANRVYTIIIDEVVKELGQNFTKDKKDETYILKGISGCKNALLEIENIRK